MAKKVPSFRFIRTRNVKAPARGTQNSAGIDFFIPEEIEAMAIEPGESVLIPSGIKAIIPTGYVGNFYNKSGIGKAGLLVGAQVVDSDYRGEIHLNVHNVTNVPIGIKPGQKLVQMEIQEVKLDEPVEITEEEFLAEADTERGTGGFGSTGA